MPFTSQLSTRPTTTTTTTTTTSSGGGGGGGGGSSVNLVQNMGDVLCRGSGDRSSPSGVQGRSPGSGSGGRSPPEAEAILDFYMHNFDLILYYFPPLQILGDVSPVPPRFTPLGGVVVVVVVVAAVVVV